MAARLAAAPARFEVLEAFDAVVWGRGLARAVELAGDRHRMQRDQVAAMGSALAHGQDHVQAGRERGVHLLRQRGVALVEVLAPLAVAEQHALHAEVDQHRRRHRDNPPVLLGQFAECVAKDPAIRRRALAWFPRAVVEIEGRGAVESLWIARNGSWNLKHTMPITIHPITKL